MTNKEKIILKYTKKINDIFYKKTKRNLAFFKKSGKKWTDADYRKISKYCGGKIELIEPLPDVLRRCRYMFDDGDNNDWLFPWGKQKEHPNFRNCRKIAYEDMLKEMKW